MQRNYKYLQVTDNGHRCGHHPHLRLQRTTDTRQLKSHGKLFFYFVARSSLRTLDE